MGTDITRTGGGSNPDDQQRIKQARISLEKKWSTERIDLYSQIIGKSRWAVDQTPPTGTEKIAMLGTWAELLDEIPTEHLNECYINAAKHKKDTYPINAMDMLQAWVRVEAGLYPPDGYAFEKDARGNWKRLARDPHTGLFPWGCKTLLEAEERNRKERGLWLAARGFQEFDND
jgi:hypothetical protein